MSRTLQASIAIVCFAVGAVSGLIFSSHISKEARSALNDSVDAMVTAELETLRRNIALLSQAKTESPTLLPAVREETVRHLLLLSALEPDKTELTLSNGPSFCKLKDAWSTYGFSAEDKVIKLAYGVVISFCWKQHSSQPIIQPDGPAFGGHAGY